MKKSNVSIILALICCLVFLQVVQATDLNLRINTSLNSVESNAYFITKTSSSYLDGLDGYDSVVISPPSNYSQLYSTVSSNLMVDAWNNATTSRTINLTYSVDASQTGNLNLTWSHANYGYGVVLNDYGSDSNRQTLNSSVNLFSASSYLITGYNGGTRYFSLEIVKYSSAINITPTRNNINVTNNINLTAIVTSSDGISSVWVNVTYPNSTSVRYDLATTYYPNYYFNSSILSLAGEYLITYYANNSGSSVNYSDWFEVYNRYFWNVSFVNGSGNVVNNINISFYRPNTSIILNSLNNITSNGLASFNVNQRFYDLKSVFSNGDSVLIRNVNMSNQILYWNLQNFSTGDLILPSLYRKFLAGIASNSTDFVNNSIQINFDFSDSTNRGCYIAPCQPATLKILKCSDWNYSSASCSTSWVALTTSKVSLIDNMVANSSGFSAYVLAESSCGNGGCESIYGETSSTCASDCPAAGGTTYLGGGGGGGSSGLTTEDVSKIEEIVKSFLNVGGIKLETASIYKEVFAGEQTTVRIQLQNTLNAPKTISLSIDGAIVDLISFDDSRVNLKPSEERSVMMKIVIPKTVNPGNYEGDLILTSEKEQGKIPVAIRVLSPEGKLIDVRVQPLLQTVAPGNVLKVQTDIANTGKAASVNGTLDLQLLDIQTGEVVLRQQESFNVESSSSSISEIEIPADFKTQKYMLKAVATYLDLDKNEVQISSIAYVEINYALLERKILFVPVWAWLLTFVVLGLIFGIYYTLYKIAENKRRYRVSVNLASLPQAGKNSEFVGKIAETGIRAFFDLNKLQTHTLIAGSTGSGKTVAAQDLVEAALLHNKSVVVFDPTAQWTGFLKKCEDGSMLKRYKYFDMNEKSATGFKGTLKTVTDPYEIIDLPKYTSQPGAITVFDVSHLTPKEIDLFVASSIEQVFKSNPQEARELKSLLVYDEVHRLLPKFGGSGEGFLQLERGAREFRKWGIGLLLISQVLSDFVGEVKANIGTEIQMGTRYDGDLERINMKYGEDVLKSVVKEAVGTGMIVNAEYNRGKPYFVSFRPLLHNTQRLSDSDLKRYTEYFEKIENIEEQIVQLEKHKVDIVDLQLETKLARNKIAVGQFQLAEMYLDPLIKKLEEMWKKIGKKPVEKKREKFTKSDIESGVKKAKVERQKFIKKEEINK